MAIIRRENRDNLCESLPKIVGAMMIVIVIMIKREKERSTMFLQRYKGGMKTGTLMVRNGTGKGCKLYN